MSIIILLVLLSIIMTFGTYCIIKGGSMNKTNEEIKIEDEEQIEYLKKYNEVKGKNRNGKSLYK
jgi:hypothetical protein